ncbi:cupin domain-containing protein [Massilia sp. W12]|uniref:cupin-like domain-containing protein n=1 Tax=Massilia sp. W12 TaxID=3126507 RepID=UPI0030D514CB
MHTWSWENLCALPQSLLTLSDQDGEPAGRILLSEYIHALLNGIEHRYAAGWRFFQQHPQMLQDFSEPEVSRNDILQAIPERLFAPLLWVFIGGAKTGTGLHQDVLHTHAWLAVLQGGKRVALHAPADFEADFAQRQQQARAVLQSGTEQDGWLYFFLQAGDILLIPAGWWHVVENTAPTLALTRNFALPEQRAQIYASAQEQSLTRILPWLASEVCV